MNIVHLISNKVWGGGERYALDLCKALRADGHNVTAITRAKKAVAEPFAREELLAATMAMRGFAAFTVAPVTLASYLNKLEGKVLVHVHNFKDAAIAISARRLARNPERIRIAATRHLVKAAKTTRSHLNIYHELDSIIFVSQLALDTFLSSSPAVDRSKLHVVHNSVAIEPDDAPKPEGTPANIIFTGRIAKEKGLDVLIDALAMLKDIDWRLTVCGTGTGRVVMPIVRGARSLGINDRIDWKGHVDNVMEELKKAHIAAMPSVCAESFGLAAIEAMSRGCAVVASDNGAQTEFLENGVSALLVAPGNADALAAALRRLIENPDFRKKIAENGLNVFKERFVYSEFYRKTLNALL